MGRRRAICELTAAERLNFVVTNRLPRRLASDVVGWFSRLEQPIAARAGIALWRLFCDVDLADAATTRFASLHDAFTRELRPGARPPDPRADVLASPCDAIVGATGAIDGDVVEQIKGAPYRLSELLGASGDLARLEGGAYATLRLTAGMYHRFHAPHDLVVEEVVHIAGDCWNVNPPALKAIDRLYCRNERAVLRCRLSDGTPLVLVAVAAVLVGSIRLTFLDLAARPRRAGRRAFAIGAARAKGEEMGWFEHGSTIVMLTPPGYALAVGTGERIRAGQAIARRSR